MVTVSAPWVEQLNPIRGHTISGAIALVEKAAAHDGASAINEQALLTLRHDADSATTYAVVGADHSFIGFALVSAGTAELVVDPEHRRQGIGTALLERVLANHGEPLGIWSHNEHPGAEALATRHSLHAARNLWQMRLTADVALPELEVPVGVSIRSFIVGTDEQMWLDLNARSFAAHAEQGRMTLADLQARQAEPWFSADGFLIAERDGAPVGFHWTKVHMPDEHGEVYVVGVDPAAQGGGLGRALTLAGLHHLRERGIGEILLYVDESNPAAIRVYERLGFTHTHTDVCFSR